MSEQPEEVAAETPAAEVVEGTDGDVDDGADGGAEELDGAVEADPDEEEAELQASVEREQELAAERQEEAASLEAQQREQDQKRKKLDQLAGHVAKRYGEILGDDLDGFVPCALCSPWFPGIRLPVMPDYETVSAVKVAIGEDPDPPLMQDRHSIECSDCGGLGKVLTGSKVSTQKSAQCLSCGGTGWQPTDNKRQAGSVVAPSAPPYQPVPGEVLANGDEPPEVAKLKELGFIVVPPVQTPEAIAAQGG